MRFEEMGLREELLRAITEGGYTQPTPIQERAIPQALEGRDLICCAQTGTGKTAAFALPILHRLAAGERANLRALVLVPTRELAMQVGRSLADYGRHLELVSTTVFGGVPLEPQEMMLRHGVDILVATPGRLKDHIWRGNIDFRHTAVLVLDEADRMLDMGFIKDVRQIVELLPVERQSMLFSATLEVEIRRLARDILRDPLRIEVAPPASTLDEVDQFLVRTTRGEKGAALEALIRAHGMRRTIIFARTKSGASRLATRLRERGHKASAIHSDRSQGERIRALEGFREGRIHLLVATDIAARGIDIRDVSHVVNFDLPFAAKDYVHRIGRTARAGRRGMAISLVTPEDSRSVAAIERLISRRLTLMDGRGGESSRLNGRGSESSRRRADPAGDAAGARAHPRPGVRSEGSARAGAGVAAGSGGRRAPAGARGSAPGRPRRSTLASGRRPAECAAGSRSHATRGVERRGAAREPAAEGAETRRRAEEPGGLIRAVVASLKSGLWSRRR